MSWSSNDNLDKISHKSISNLKGVKNSIKLIFNLFQLTLFSYLALTLICMKLLLTLVMMYSVSVPWSWFLVNRSVPSNFPFFPFNLLFAEDDPEQQCMAQNANCDSKNAAKAETAAVKLVVRRAGKDKKLIAWSY